eukprot:gene10801-3268_t
MAVQDLLTRPLPWELTGDEPPKFYQDVVRQASGETGDRPVDCQVVKGFEDFQRPGLHYISAVEKISASGYGRVNQWGAQGASVLRRKIWFISERE